jgi:hypothetical protein
MMTTRILHDQTKRIIRNLQEIPKIGDMIVRLTPPGAACTNVGKLVSIQKDGDDVITWVKLFCDETMHPWHNATYIKVPNCLQSELDDDEFV